jgi:hypothetical protein
VGKVRRRERRRGRRGVIRTGAPNATEDAADHTEGHAEADAVRAGDEGVHFTLKDSGGRRRSWPTWLATWKIICELAITSMTTSVRGRGWNREHRAGGGTRCPRRREEGETRGEGAYGARLASGLRPGRAGSATWIVRRVRRREEANSIRELREILA